MGSEMCIRDRNKLLLLLLFSIGFLQFGSAQAPIDWFALNDVTFEKIQDEQFGLSYDKATFGEWVKSLDGQEVIITGYMIPMDALGTSYAVSRNPNSSCFFCGGAGPETVIRLWMSPDAVQRYQTDEYLNWQGTLRLNASNQHAFIYEMWDAKPVK